MIELAASDRRGRIGRIRGFEGAGARGGNIFRLSPKDLIKLPHASELFMLPHRIPVAYDRKDKNFKALDDLTAVAAFLRRGRALRSTSSSAAAVALGASRCSPWRCSAATAPAK